MSISPHPDAAMPAAAATSPSPDPGAGPDPVTAEHAELQRQGAKAAARGEATAANPMLEPINQPGTTGESEQVWSGRRDAWARGHRTQGPPVPVSAPPPCGPAFDHRRQDEPLFGVTRVLTFAGATGLTSASGFFFAREDRLFLITSAHVLFDAPAGHAPDRIEIGLHADPVDLTRLVTLSILLHRDGLAVWRQAWDSGGAVDVAAIELDRQALAADCVLRPFGPQHLPRGFGLFQVGDSLAIPGFPLGFFDTVHHLPVVRQASIASGYGVRFQGHGYFLTDARMHRGSSGSPVLARIQPSVGEAPDWCLLGVHSSRLDMATRDAVLDESLGLNCAWYADVLLTLTADGDRLQP